ncbi:uncharacterized protein LOC129729078 [Wyeomyia smithii]|uniref:uncharacterized protein LOC129729078 n=1 Tax=Wyeomyia smithii TaxID=174621 RepID=UPI0024680254|nr:uncharacterized protein LOC129729078 [Wyeomyia smithii]
MGALLDRRVDFALAALGAWHPFHKYFSFSDPIMQIGVGCLTPKPKLIKPWKIVFLMFSRPVWILIIITFSVISLFEYASSVIFKKPEANQQRKSLPRSFINVFGAFLLLPAELGRTRVSEIIFSVSLLLVTFITGYVYIGKIHSFLVIPVFQLPIDTISDFAVSHLPWYGRHDAWIYALNGSENYHIESILNTYRTDSSASLQELANQGDVGFVLGVLNYGHFMVGSWLTAENSEQYRLMSELLYYEYDTGYATKTWPLLGNFNDLAMWIREACLYRYVELIEVYKYMNYRVQSSIEHSRDKQQYSLKPLAVEEISGGLMLFCCGSLIAITQSDVAENYAHSLKTALLEVGNLIETTLGAVGAP